jgi:hypothetical protein
MALPFDAGRFDAAARAPAERQRLAHRGTPRPVDGRGTGGCRDARNNSATDVRRLR